MDEPARRSWIPGPWIAAPAALLALIAVLGSRWAAAADARPSTVLFARTTALDGGTLVSGSAPLVAAGGFRFRLSPARDATAESREAWRAGAQRPPVVAVDVRAGERVISRVDGAEARVDDFSKESGALVLGEFSSRDDRVEFDVRVVDPRGLRGLPTLVELRPSGDYVNYAWLEGSVRRALVVLAMLVAVLLAVVSRLLVVRRRGDVRGGDGGDASAAR